MCILCTIIKRVHMYSYSNARETLYLDTGMGTTDRVGRKTCRAPTEVKLMQSHASDAAHLRRQSIRCAAHANCI